MPNFVSLKGNLKGTTEFVNADNVERIAHIEGKTGSILCFTSGTELLIGETPETIFEKFRDNSKKVP